MVEAASNNAESITLDSGQFIKMMSAPYFLITKLEAFKGRGNGDYLMSHEIEDIVAVLDGRPEVFDEIRRAEPSLQGELCIRFQALITDVRFVDSITGHMPADTIGQNSVDKVLRTGATR